MFELPEFVTLARQMNETLQGKTIRSGSLGNLAHKFVWYNRTPEEFAQLTPGKTIGEARAQGRWLFLPLQPGYVMLFGECGGKLLYHPAGTERPKTHHLFLTLDDGSALTATTQMWGAYELYDAVIVDTVQEVIAQGGRCDEVDLYGRPGGYVRLMDKESLGRPCPGCGGAVEKVQYLGGACYYCPTCQR